MTNDFEFSGKHLHEWISCLSHVVSDAALGCTLWHGGVIPHFRSRLSRFNWFLSFLFEYSRKYYLIIPCNQNYPVVERNGTWLMRDTARQLPQLLFNPFPNSFSTQNLFTQNSIPTKGFSRCRSISIDVFRYAFNPFLHGNIIQMFKQILRPIFCVHLDLEWKEGWKLHNRLYS